MADPIKAVFLAALDTPPDQRLAYLERACCGDAGVRRRVEALLRAHEETDRLLDHPVWHPETEPKGADSEPAAEPTERAGRVQLLGEIARGGMGAVLRGHDAELGRELAVKVILPAHRNNPDLVRRFVGEARLAGQLQHPGIMPVYDVGQLTDGRPFFTMKLIQGRTLAELLAGRTDPSHDLPRFLRYFEAVCQAVGYAHANGIIHRDLKPLNVMVGAFGEVQVMDWGLAKRLEEGADAAPEPTPPLSACPSSTPLPAALTRPGAVVGTPGYLAPEQARGRAGDQRSDVFGLGAILCEILTGAPPFHRAGLIDLLRQAREGNLSAATDDLDRCGADPELVRLAKDCLAPVPADRPADGSAVAARMGDYLAGVQERLRSAEVGQARAEARAEGERTRRRLTVGLAAAFLALVALGGGTLLLVQRHQAEQSREEARRQQAAESALARAADLRQQGRWDEALAVLEQARQRLDERDGPVCDDVRRAVAELELVGRLERVRLRAATWTGRSLDWARADREYEAEFRAAGLGGPDEPPEPVAERVRDSGVRAALVAALDTWALCTADPARRDWARAVAQGADQGGEWAQRLRASWNDPVALEALAREAPVDHLSPHLLNTLAVSLDNRRESVLLLGKAQAHYPGDFWVNYSLALRLMAEGRHAEATRFFQAALAARPGTLAVVCDLGVALKAQGRLEDACDCFRQAIVMDPGFAFAHTNLGTVLLALNRPDEAIACFHKAIKIDPNLANAHTNLGVALEGAGRRAEAVACWRKAIEVDPSCALAHYNLGNALSDQDPPTEAIACFRRAIEVDPKNARAYTNLGVALNGQKRHDEAIACFHKALESDPNRWEAHVGLGSVHVDRKEFSEGIAHLRKAVELAPADAQNHYILGNAYIAAGELDRAVESLRKAAEIDPGYAEAHCNLGHALMRRGDFAEALGPLRRGHELGSKRAGWKKYPSDIWVSNCERLIALEQQLLGILGGGSEPASAEKRIAWVRLCVQTRRYAAAAQLSGEAFAEEGKLADDLDAEYRYRAATAAALAGTGQGRDAGNLTNAAMAVLRKQALDWLRADLTLRTRQLNSDKPADRAAAQLALGNWQKDTHLACFRDPAALAKLPAEEQTALAQMWADVAATLRKAEEKTK